MYTTESYTTYIAVSDYKKRYIDIPTFTEYCKACPNYDRLWSCPSYTFDVEAFWNQFQTLDLFAVKILYNDDYAGKQFSEHKIADIMRQSLNVEKARISRELFRLEEKYPGSVSLSAGSCSLCHDNCTRPDGLPCRYPDKLRYSIESLGGNVGLTLSQCMGIDLEWMEEGRLPHYFVLVSGLLRRKTPLNLSDYRYSLSL